MVLGLVSPGFAHVAAVRESLEWLPEWGASVPRLVSHHLVGVPHFCAARGSQGTQGENLMLPGLLRPRLESPIGPPVLHPTDKTLSRGWVQFKGVKDTNLFAGGRAVSHDTRGWTQEDAAPGRMTTPPLSISRSSLPPPELTRISNLPSAELPEPSSQSTDLTLLSSSLISFQQIEAANRIAFE